MPLTLEKSLLEIVKAAAAAAKAAGIREAKIRLFMEMGIVEIQEAEGTVAAVNETPTPKADGKDDETDEGNGNRAHRYPVTKRQKRRTAADRSYYDDAAYSDTAE